MPQLLCIFFLVRYSFKRLPFKYFSNQKLWSKILYSYSAAHLMGTKLQRIFETSKLLREFFEYNFFCIEDFIAGIVISQNSKVTLLGVVESSL